MHQFLHSFRKMSDLEGGTNSKFLYIWKVLLEWVFFAKNIAGKEEKLRKSLIMYKL